jgi:4'-phosphopantetheinyl transferase EntD
MARRISHGDIAQALNGLIREGVIASFRTNFADKREPLWVPEVAIVPGEDVSIATAVARVQEAVRPLGIDTVTVEVAPRSKSTG